MSHRCPSHCHRCPDLGGDILPGCIGTAAMAMGPRDMSRCTCIRSERKKVDSLEETIRKLTKRIEALENGNE